MLFVTPPWGTKNSKQYQSSTVTTPPHLNNHRDFNDLLMCKLLTTTPNPSTQPGAECAEGEIYHQIKYDL